MTSPTDLAVLLSGQVRSFVDFAVRDSWRAPREPVRGRIVRRTSSCAVTLAGATLWRASHRPRAEWRRRRGLLARL